MRYGLRVAAPSPHPGRAAAYSITRTAVTPTNNWITDRRPTEADADKDGEVVLRRFADGRRDSTLGKRDALVDWRHIGEGVPWKHTDIWQPPAAPEPTPTKPALAVGQRWRRRDGEVVRIFRGSNGFRAGEWSYHSDGTAPFGAFGTRPQYDLIELLPPELSTPTPRKFASISRVAAHGGYLVDAIDEDGVAWWMAIIPGDSMAERNRQWHQLTPLPAKEPQQ